MGKASAGQPKFNPPADVRQAFSPHTKINVLLVGGPYHWRTVPEVPLDLMEIYFIDHSSPTVQTWQEGWAGVDPGEPLPNLRVHRYMQWQEFHMPGVGDHPPSFLYKYMETR